MVYHFFFRKKKQTKEEFEEQNNKKEQDFKNFYMNKLVSDIQKTISSYDKKYFDPLLISQFQRENELSVFKIVIRDGKITIENLITYNKPEEYIKFLKKTFKKLEERYSLPNCMFLLTIKDTEIESEFPVFMNSCHKDYYSDKKVLFHPNWYFFNQERVKESLENFISWDMKTEKAVWRGSDSNRIKEYGNDSETSRVFIVNTGLEDEENFDTGFYKIEEENKKKMKKFKLKNYLSPAEQCNYKYIISTDGWGGTHGLYWALSSGSCVLNNTKYKQWFSELFKNNDEYIKYNDTEENNDLSEIVNSLVNNDKRARITAEDSKKTAEIVFDEDFVLEYFFQLIKIYAYKQNLHFELI